MTNGVWKKYNPPRFHQMEIQRIDKELPQKRYRLIWKKMEQQSQEIQDGKGGREELFKVIKKFGNTPIQNNTNEQGTGENTPIEETDDYSEETTPTNSSDSMDAPAIIFKKYLRGTGVRCI